MSAARAIECRKPALQSRSGHTAPDLQFRGAVALWLELVAQRAAVRERGSGTETGARRHLLTRQQTLALLEDQMGGAWEPRAAHTDAPDAIGRANLPRWKIGQLEMDMHTITQPAPAPAGRCATPSCESASPAR